MDWVFVLSATIAAALAVYLSAALLKPEWFS